MRISDWSSDVCSSDLVVALAEGLEVGDRQVPRALVDHRALVHLDGADALGAVIAEHVGAAQRTDRLAPIDVAAGDRAAVVSPVLVDRQDRIGWVRAGLERVRPLHIRTDSQTYEITTLMRTSS